MNAFKEKIRSEWTPTPFRQQVINFVGLLIMTAMVVIVAKFGWTVGVVFAITTLGVSIILGKRK